MPTSPNASRTPPPPIEEAFMPASPIISRRRTLSQTSTIRTSPIQCLAATNIPFENLPVRNPPTAAIVPQNSPFSSLFFSQAPSFEHFLKTPGGTPLPLIAYLRFYFKSRAVSLSSPKLLSVPPCLARHPIRAVTQRAAQVLSLLRYFIASHFRIFPEPLNETV
jgi:hypothetical protein